MSERIIPPRLFRVRYCTRGPRPRRQLAFVKCPYGGLHDLYAMTAALTRAVNTRQIRWFRIDTEFEITPEIRAAMLRWPEALGRDERTVWE